MGNIESKIDGILDKAERVAVLVGRGNTIIKVGEVAIGEVVDFINRKTTEGDNEKLAELSVKWDALLTKEERIAAGDSVIDGGSGS